MRFDARIDAVGEGADGAGRSHAVEISARRREQPRAGAREFGVALSELQAECGRLGMHAVRAADRRRHLVSIGASLGVEQLVTSRDQKVGARTNCTLRQVSSTSEEVMPWWTKRASGR